MRKIFAFVLVAVAVLFIASYSYIRSRIVTVPTCGVALLTPPRCASRRWGNAVELDCPVQNKIVYCNDLKQASPK